MTEQFTTYSEEQHRQGQRADGFPPDCRVVSADLYNSLVDKYNELLQEYDEVVWMYEDLC